MTARLLTSAATAAQAVPPAGAATAGAELPGRGRRTARARQVLIPAGAACVDGVWTYQVATESAAGGLLPGPWFAAALAVTAALALPFRHRRPVLLVLAASAGLLMGAVLAVTAPVALYALGRARVRLAVVYLVALAMALAPAAEFARLHRSFTHLVLPLELCGLLVLLAAAAVAFPPRALRRRGTPERDGTWWWTAPRALLFDLAVAVVVAGCDLRRATFAYPSGQDPHPAVVLPGLLAVAAVSAAVVVRRRYPVAVCVAALLCVPLPTFVPEAALFVALYSAAAYGRSRAVLAGLCAAACPAVVVGRMLAEARVGGPRFAPEIVVELGLIVAVPALLGLYVGARRMVLDGLRERADRLERERHLLAAQARVEERARIAREMHDVVANRVSLMVVHAGALEADPAQSPRGREAGRLIGGVGRQALDELRQVLSVLRGDRDEAPPPAQPTLDGLGALLEDSRSTGAYVTSDVTGEQRPLPGALEHTAYRAIQEALTNVRKHAGRADTRVTLDYRPDGLHLTVENERPTAPPPPGLPSSGHGIEGLGERVALLGGRVEAAPRPDGGFRLTAWLPEAHEA
ncbi:sensor histidine kinase [Streptomyces sp. NPDC048639]|uniref:sensor histidine kinase n=1 Tax=Streptomyces sp. NPDC048639 TaxID=3365581 RepID=UPI0037116370